MKKSFLFLAVCAAALTACTSEEVIKEGVQSNAIGFQQLVGKESRVVTTDNFAAFHVYGYYTKEVEGSADPTVVSVFNDDVVTKSEGVWSYSNTRYWVPGAKYYFYAYSCDNQEAPTGTASFNLNGKTVSERALGLKNYVSHNHDLVYAFNEGGEGAPGIVGKDADNAKVSLNFAHILTRVSVTFKSAFAAGYQIKVSNVKFSGIYNEGDFSPKPDFAWTGIKQNAPEGTTPEVEFTMAKKDDKVQDVATAATDAVPAVGTEGEEGYLPAIPAKAAVNAVTASNYVIPYAYETNVTLSFDIDVMDKDDNIVYEQTIKGTWTPEWKMSTAYNYNITISGTAAGLKPIEFAVGQTITGWNDPTAVIPGEDDGNDNTINIDMTFESTAKNNE